MNLYLISQTVSKGYDTFDSAVVVAETEEEARNTHPIGRTFTQNPGPWLWSKIWCSPQDVKVQQIGVATNEYENQTVLCASYNA